MPEWPWRNSPLVAYERLEGSTGPPRVAAWATRKDNGGCPQIFPLRGFWAGQPQSLLRQAPALAHGRLVHAGLVATAATAVKDTQPPSSRRPISQERVSLIHMLLAVDRFDIEALGGCVLVADGDSHLPIAPW